MKKNQINITEIMLAILSGLLLTACFPKIGFAWLAWVALVPLLFSIRNQHQQHAFKLGLLTGFVHFITLLYWLVHTMRVYGYLPLALSVLILILFALYLSLYLALFSATLVRLAKSSGSCIVLIPVLWVAQEYLRSFLFTGFPWEMLGYSQYLSSRLIQVADVLGVYGVSFLIALSNAAGLMALLTASGKNWQNTAVGWRSSASAAVGFGILFICTWFYGEWRLNAVDRQIVQADTITVAIVQGNIDQTVKWDPAFQQETVDAYLSKSLSLKKNRPDLIVWPETATPFYFLHEAKLSARVKKGIREADTFFLIGSPSVSPGKEGLYYYNSAYLIGADGECLGQYNKVHLVPFGEYVPFKQWLPFLGKIVAQVGDFKPGTRGGAMPWQGRKIGPLICFEIIFPNLSRAMAQNQAAFLVNMTNDAWFGQSAGPHQHFSMSIFRSIENRKALIRSANTGISGFIDPAGRVLATTALCEPAVLTRPVSLMNNLTLYARYGDFFATLCLVFFLLCLLIRPVLDIIRKKAV